MTELLIFGVDGLNHDMVQHLIKKGKMPNFKKLQEREGSVYGEFESYIVDGYQTPHTGVCWTTLYTGLDEEGHGITSGGWNDGDSKFHVTKTVWDKLSDETGKEMILYGMPMTYRAKPIQGEMVSGFVSNTLKSMWSSCVYPESLEKRLPDDFIEYTSSYVAKVKTEGAQPQTDTENFFNEISHSEAQRIATFTELYNEDSADIVAYGTTFVDKIGHVAGINEDSEKAVEAYIELDETLGLLLETLRPEDVAIISDHGFTDYSHSINGYALDTTGRGLDDVFSFTPYLLDMYGLEYDKSDYGPTGENQNLSDQEINDVKKQLDAMGYFQ